MTSDYPRRIVLLGYFAETQRAGTAAERQAWSDALYARYNHHIVRAAKKAGLEDPSAEARGIMALMALFAPGASPQSKSARAVQAYLEYRGR
jgi:hypothetical protein